MINSDKRPTDPDKIGKTPVRRHLPKLKKLSSKPKLFRKNSQNNKYLKFSKSSLSTNMSIFSSKLEMMGLAGINPPVGINGNVFVSKIQDPTFIKPRYAVQNDIITDNIVMPNPHKVLKKYSSSYLKNKKIKVYKYTGEDPNKKLMSILNSVDKKVDSLDYIYEALTGRELLGEDQIDYDEDFKLIDFNEIQRTIENDAYSILNEAIFMSIPDIAKKYKIVSNDESYKLLLNQPKDIVILEDSKLGYFATNRKTLRRTKYYSEISDIVIGDDLKYE